MDEKSVIGIALISLFFKFVLMNKSFIVDLQSSGTWSKDEELKFNGNIPTLTEFTSCHWERDTYFAIKNTNIWSYCFHGINDKNDMKCVQLYYQGDRRVANRDVIFGGYFYGWTDKAIDIKIPVRSFQHRTWNHFCWAYSSIARQSSLFYNGNLVATASLSNYSVHPIISGTDNVDKHLFVIGQEPDSLDGDYSEDQAVFGSISEFNLWDYVVDPSLIVDAANCKTKLKGNVISWEEGQFDIKLSTKTSIQTITELCKHERYFVVFTESHSKASAKDICTSHGGRLVLPGSKTENQNIFESLKDHDSKCLPSNRANSNIGKLIWLGLQSSSRGWEDDNGDSLGPENYTNWGLNVKQLDNPGWNGGCAFMTTDGSWAYAGDECFDITLCFVCSIPRSTVLTLKGTCNLGSVFHWNFYPTVNSTHQISSFEGYKRGQKMTNINGVWSLEVQGAKINLEKKAISPIGRNLWNWYETSCKNSALEMRNLTLSKCTIGEQFTCNSGHCVDMAHRCDNKVDCTDRSDEKECARVDIPEEYEKDDPPTYPFEGEEVIWMDVKLDIEKINHIDTKNMIIQVTYCMLIWWWEPRITFKNLSPNDRNLIDKIDYNKMWLPLDHLDHKNAVIGKIRQDFGKTIEIIIKTNRNRTISHPEPVDVTKSLEEYRYIPEKNLIRMRQRFRVDVECIFYLQKYPFDEQLCDIIFKIRSLGDKKMAFLMRNNSIRYSGTALASHLQVVNATSNISSTCSTIPHVQNPCEPWEDYLMVTQDAIKFTLHLRRAPLHHIKSIFIPCMGLWLIAYLTSLLRVNDFTNRNRISVTVLLALVTLFGATANTDDYPQTTYLKYIDVWFLFYLSSLLLIIIHHIAMEMMWHDPDKINHNMVGDVVNGEARKEKHDKQRYLKRLSTIFFPVTIIIFNAGYFAMTK